MELWHCGSAAMPKNEVVRKAILDYSERTGRLNERERLRLLKVFDEMVPKIPQEARKGRSGDQIHSSGSTERQ